MMRGSVKWRGRRWTFDVVALIVMLVVLPLAIVVMAELREGNMLTAYILLILAWLVVAVGEVWSP